VLRSLFQKMNTEGWRSCEMEAWFKRDAYKGARRPTHQQISLLQETGECTPAVLKAKEGFTAAVGLAWQRVVHAANYLCDPAVSCRSPDMKLQLMRPDMVKKLAKGINNIRYVHFLRRSGAPMTKTGTLCSHGSISHSIEELWSMPCIISWTSVLQAAFHSRPLLIVCSPLSSTAAEPL